MNSSSADRKIIGVLQSSYLPWMPFFERLEASDVFVLLDDVEYSKNTAFNRNSIKTQNGGQLLTVPIRYKGNSRALIKEICINTQTPWQKKHWRTLEQAYGQAPYWSNYRVPLEELICQRHEKLIDVVAPIIRFLAREFSIDTPFHVSTDIGATGSRNEKLVDICRHFNGSHFIVKSGTYDYHPSEEFEPHGIRLVQMNYSKFVYPQLHGDFVPNLSALDYLLNCGPGRPPFSAIVNERNCPVP